MNAGVVDRSVNQVTLLPPAAELNSATAASSALAIVETIPDDDYVLARDATCEVSADITSVTTLYPCCQERPQCTPRSCF
jgi:hypothetical protein